MPRPKIKPPYSWLEKLDQILSVVFLVGLIALTVSSMVSLPDRFPTHFGASGLPDKYGGKDSFLLLPILAVIFYIAFTLLERFPWAFNYADIEITEENAVYLYKSGRQILEWMKLIIITIFLYLQWQSFQVAKNLSVSLGIWFLPVSLLALFGGLGYNIHKIRKNK
jgi:uncharacterized membrane protein